MEWVASTLHTTSEHGVSSITTADAYTSDVSSRLNWRPRRFINGLVRFAERRNLVSARVSSHFKRSLTAHTLLLSMPNIPQKDSYIRHGRYCILALPRGHTSVALGVFHSACFSKFTVLCNCDALCGGTYVPSVRLEKAQPSKGPATQNAVCRSGLRSLSAAECYILSRLF